jgi:hypothetical protein
VGAELLLDITIAATAPGALTSARAARRGTDGRRTYIFCSSSW